tara:strand:- start:135 stop:332 length:198 start_codon:yes stop_codon:yes gene_type:complete
MTKKLDELANLWEKTKDPIYKDLWYKFVKEFANGRDGTLDDDLCDERRGTNNKNSNGVRTTNDPT